ncbi:Hypothetical predicted protein, partial [Pelobates cultripes]
EHWWVQNTASILVAVILNDSKRSCPTVPSGSISTPSQSLAIGGNICSNGITRGEMSLHTHNTQPSHKTLSQPTQCSANSLTEHSANPYTHNTQPTHTIFSQFSAEHSDNPYTPNIQPSHTHRLCTHTIPQLTASQHTSDTNTNHKTWGFFSRTQHMQPQSHTQPFPPPMPKCNKYGLPTACLKTQQTTRRMYMQTTYTALGTEIPSKYNKELSCTFKTLTVNTFNTET